MRHIISVLIENESGALSRVAGLFSARGFNIESLTVATTNDTTLSRMTIVSVGSDKIIEQIVKQLNKLIDVFKVVDLTTMNHVERELLLVKISVNKTNNNDVEKQVNKFSAKVVDTTSHIWVIELAEKSSVINDFLSGFDSSIIIAVSRTGVTGVCKGLPEMP